MFYLRHENDYDDLQFKSIIFDMGKEKNKWKRFMKSKQTKIFFWSMKEVENERFYCKVMKIKEHLTIKI